MVRPIYTPGNTTTGPGPWVRMSLFVFPETSVSSSISCLALSLMKCSLDVNFALSSSSYSKFCSSQTLGSVSIFRMSGSFPLRASLSSSHEGDYFYRIAITQPLLAMRFPWNNESVDLDSHSLRRRLQALKQLGDGRPLDETLFLTVNSNRYHKQRQPLAAYPRSQALRRTSPLSHRRTPRTDCRDTADCKSPPENCKRV